MNCMHPRWPFFLYPLLFLLLILAGPPVSADTSVGGTIATDTTWTLADSPYIVTTHITVQGTDGTDGITTLTIEPGVQVRFNGNYYLAVGATSGNPGALNAQGSAANPIVFTSNKPTPAAGDWSYIRFNTTATNCLMEYCSVAYGGSSYGAVYLYNTSPTIENTTIQYSKYAGIYASSSSPVLTADQMSNCTTYGLHLVGSCSPDISGCSFSDNGNYDLYSTSTTGGTLTSSTFNNGLYIASGAEMVISGNTFNYHNNYPIHLGADGVGQLISANTLTGLDSDSTMEVTADTIEHDAAWTAALKYTVLGSITVKGTDGTDSITTLTMEPGVQMRFNGNYYLAVGVTSGDPGALNASGSASDPIVFTSNKPTPAAGDWMYIRFYTTAADSLMDHCVVEYGGSSYGAVYLYNTSPTIENTTIQYSKYAGIYASSSSPTLTTDQISNCTTYGLHLVGSSSPDISSITFSGNGNYDLYSTSTSGGTLTDSTFNNGFYMASGANEAISGNTFNYNNSYPIRLGADGVGQLVSANTLANLDSDSYIEVTADTIEQDSTWTAALKYTILGNITVKGTDGADSITTLTLDPGVQMRFNGNYYLAVGATSGDPGALNAQGNADNPIVFTSNKSTPAAGDWMYIRFYTTATADSLMDHCVVEYSGYSYGSVYLYNASPTIENTTIRYSKNAGIYAGGAGCSSAKINCNTFTNNLNGLYWTNTPPAELTANNFTANTHYGLYYSSSAAFTAENNWWGDAAGPNQGGDAIHGNVDADPWSTAENQCSATGENHAPNEPNTPNPADQAVRVDSGSGVTLSWIGGDPDPLDTVTYDLYWGTSSQALTLTAQDIAVNQYAMVGLTAGITYYWQIIARDNRGLETLGPIWRFTTIGGSPDLIISQAATIPVGNLQSGQSVTLTASVSNVGSGPSVDAFGVSFQVDGLAIGTAAVDQVLLAGQSIQASQTWTYTGGDPGIEINADSASQVSETHEDNNRFIALLSEVADNSSPGVTASTPAAGAFLQQLENITATLVDTQGMVDDAAVMASFSLLNSSQQTVAGAITEANDTFIFVPSSLPLADGPYQVSLTAADTYGNAQNHAFSFTIDTMPPAKPVITGGTIASGLIQARPAENSADQFVVDITGTREAGTAVWINGTQQVLFGDDPWSVTVPLQSGDNTFEIWLTDRAANQSASEWVDIEMLSGSNVMYEYDASGRIKSISNPE